MQALQAIGHKTKVNKNHWVFVVQFYIDMYCIADTLAASLWPEQFIQPYGKLYVRHGKRKAFNQRVMDACVRLISREESEELQL